MQTKIRILKINVGGKTTEININILLQMLPQN